MCDHGGGDGAGEERSGRGVVFFFIVVSRAKYMK